MRVLLYSPIHVSGSVEGITNNVQAIHRGLLRKGVDASLMTPTQAPGQVSHRFMSVQRGIELARLLRARTEEADIVHVNLQNPSQSLVLRGISLPKSRLVCSTWGSYVEFGEMMQVARNGGFSVPLLAEHLPHLVLNTRLTASIGLRGMATFAVSCNFVGNRIADLGLPGSQIHVIPNGVDVDEYRPPRDSERTEAREALGIGPDQTVIMYYGHVTRTRGIDHLVKAMALVLKAIPEAVFLIAESGVSTFDLGSHLVEAGIAERTIRLGRVNVPRILLAADVCVLPLVSHVASAMIPNSILEMMAAGLPVVTTPVGAIPEVVTHNRTGILVEPGRPTQLARAIIRLIGDERMRQELGQAARNLMEERYDWELAIQNLIGLYRSMAN